MPERTVVVGSRSGLHARPAALFVKAAARQPVKVRIRAGNGRVADTRSILAVLALKVTHGDTVTLEAEGGEDGAADQALDTLVALLEKDLDEEPAAG